ncbi:AAA family ATPase [Bradyrhizobium sp. Tv2a-2]|uniref:AAA family ATPase n=1 Tax=Bradyrhizobium sp. Tv2a-2 TaxID=113395 RepID=UPI0003F731BA|nr:AAA family ATPase [Bradyrhizobium sp. Tv2a-2]
MIIKGRSRAGPDELAVHLMRVDTNEVMEVIEIRGTVASDLKGAFREMSAVAAGTRCKRNLYHASINVRVEERLELEQWMYSIDSLEKRLQLLGQPRAIVMHKKHGREHLHIVWSRIDASKMCAIPDSHNYRAHEEASRELERVFGHQYTQGAHVERDGLARPKRTHSHAEQQQRDRTKGNEIASIVSEVTSLWRSTDNGMSFQAALQEKGYVLARGDRRDYVIVDRQGGIHSLARRIEGVRVAQLHARLQDLDVQSLPSAKEARVQQEARLAAQRPAPADLQSPLATFQNLLRTRSYVTEQDLEQAFEDVVTRKLAINLIREQSGTLRLYEAAGGQFVGYTTRDVCMQESATVAAARRLATTQRSPIASNHLEALREWGLSEEQAIAARQILSGMQLSVLIGRAGTGKTAALNAIRLLAERDGYKICALGPTNAVVADLKDAGFARASTIHSLLWYQDHAPHHSNAQFARKTLIVLDEAGMVDTVRLQRLLALTEQSKGDVRLVMVGDDRQLASIERGGIFANLAHEINAAKLSTVQRQRKDWARRASEAFSEGRFREGVEAFSAQGCIAWSTSLDESRAALITQYRNDTISARGKRFVFAYTNEEARRLNDTIQALEIERGRVRSIGHFETGSGTLKIGEGDRIVFRSTDKKRGIVNGLFASVLAIEKSNVTVRTDRGKLIAIDLSKGDVAVDLGYAGTIYRGQGRTLDEVYLLHTHHWRDAASYVALTRSRGTTRVFVSKDQARNLDELARQFSRQSRRGTTLDFTTANPEASASKVATLQDSKINASDRVSNSEREN